MPAQTAPTFLSPNYPGAESVHFLRARKTPARRQNFWGVALSARPLSQLPDRRNGAQGRKTPLTSLCQQLQLCHSLPQATSPRPQKGFPVRPRLRDRFGAREALGRGDNEEAGDRGPRTQSWEGKRFRGARAQRGDWAERASRRGCEGKESAWRSEPRARAVASPRPYARAAGAVSFPQARPPLLLRRVEKDRRREVWGEVGGTSHASAVSQRREG